MRKFFTLFLLLVTCICAAQNVTVFTPDDGLSSSLVKSIFEDSSGMIWVSTESGLNRYDGTRFVKYNHDPSDSHSLSNNYVNTVFEDTQGRIFVCTHAGIQQYDPYTDSFSELARILPENMSSGQITTIVERSDGELWTAGNYVCRVNIEDGNLSLVRVQSALGIDYVDYAAVDSAGNFWAVKYKKGVYKLHPDGSLQSYFMNGETVTDIIAEPDGGVYIAAMNGGLLRYDSVSDSFVRVGEEIQTASILEQLNSKVLIVSDYGRGLKFYDMVSRQTTRLSMLDDIFDLGSLRINSLLKDKTNNIWVGAYRKGLVFIPFRRNYFRYIGHLSSMENIIGDKPVMGLCRGRSGKMWVSTDGDGLYAVDNVKGTSVHYADASFPKTITSMCEDSRGRLWMSSRAGVVSIMDAVTGSRRQVDLEKEVNLRINSISGIAESENGTIWIATMGAGLVLYDPRTDSFSSPPFNSRIPQFLTGILSASDGNMYICSYDGAYSFRDDGSYSIETISSDNIVNSVSELADGVIAFGCENGLMVWSKASGKKIYSTVDGLIDNMVYSVLSDNDGSIWVSSPSGISKLDKNFVLVSSFGKEDGVRMGEAYRDVAWKDEDGTLWFGGLDGLTWFNPFEIVNSPKKWEVRITGMYIGNESVRGGMKSGRYTILDTPIYEAEKVQLSYRDNAFTLLLSTVEHGAPSRLQYEYCIDGSRWITLPRGSKRLSFSGLSTGKHNLQFRALDSGLASEPVDFTVVVHPSLWASTAAKIIYSILAVLLVTFLCLWKRKHNLAKQQIREYQHQEQINESKLEFFSNISHELKNPLSLLIGPLKQLMAVDNDPVRQRYYKTMYSNSERVLQLMNQLLDIRKIDKGGMVLKFRYTDIVPYIQKIVDSYEEQFGLKHINLKYLHDGIDTLYIYIDQTNFDKVLYNLLSNAYKYTPENGEVRLILEKVGGNARITVSDNGIGIASDELEKVFDRFYQVSGAQRLYKGGAGVGLNLARSLVELHHGEIHAEKNPEGQGSCFVVTLPLGREHIKDEDILPEDKNIYELESHVEVSPIIADVQASDEKKPLSPKTRIRVLLVDDDAGIRNFIAEELSSDFHVSQCGNGQEALDAIFKKAPDIVVSDVAMPIMDGIRLCERIRSNININHIPIILLTAKSSDEDRIAGLKTGADAYIAKPFSIDMLKTRILNLVESRRVLRNTFSGKQTHNDKLTEVKVDTLDSRLMDRIMKALDANISNPDLTIEMLASEIGISRVHLHRKLKELTNQTTSDFIRNTRLAQAAKMLSEGKCSIAEVASQVGFESQSNFSTAFKKLYGVTPREYMNQSKVEQD